MSYVRRYKGLKTNLDKLYTDIILELSLEEELNIVNELKGTVNETSPFKSVTAVRVSVPRILVGALREITISITGEPDDFIVEMHTGAWFNNLAMPGAGGLVIGGPIGMIVGAGAGGLIAIEFEMSLSKKINELVNKNSVEDLKPDNLETYE